MKVSTSSLLLLAASYTASASYAPSNAACPSGGLLRLSGTPQQGNQTLSSAETTYVTARKALIPASLVTYLGSRATTVYGGSLDNLTSSQAPTLAIALSGGGDRAALYAAGVLNSLDGRNTSSVASGTGGLLQTATYVSALSGGSWALTSTIFNNYPSNFYDLVLGNSSRGLDGWNLDLDLFSPGGSNTTLNNLFFQNIMADISRKKLAGNWNVTFGDYWSRALAYHFLPGSTAANFFDNSTDHGASTLFSNITNLSSYQDNSMPFPILVADVLSVNELAKPLTGALIPLQNVVYEMSPAEFGSYDPEVAAFIPMASLGTSLNSGSPVNGGSGGACVQGFDNAGWITGISSNLFSIYNATKIPTWTSSLSPVYAAWSTINSTFYNLQPNQQLDISALPNPFKGVGTFEDRAQDQLRLVDGGIDGQVDPIAPLVVTKRNIDTIIVADATGDTDFTQPDGSSLVATSLRSAQLPNGTVSLPPLPANNDTFVAQRLNQRPTFFGCNGTPATLNGTNVTSPYAFLVFLPNYSPSGVSNTSTGQIQYPANQSVAILDAVTTITTSGILATNGSADAMWPTCLGCAVVERMRGKTGVDRTAACEACFARYCWNGTSVASTTYSIGAAPANASGSGGAGGAASPSGSARPTGAASVNQVALAMVLTLAGAVGILIV